MKKLHLKLFAFTFLLFCSGLNLKLSAQGEYNNWVFGNGVNIDITTATPGSNSAMNTQEGCASISDAAGNLLFYTDGRSVWNGVHAFYTNGNATLNGTPNFFPGSATQGVVIVPRPGVADEYFIFTVSDRNGDIQHGLTEYIVNTTTETVLSIAETSPLENYASTEQITAVPHCNGVDYWLIIKPTTNDNTIFPDLNNPGFTFINGDEIMAYLVTNVGIANEVPVISNSGAFTIAGAGGATGPAIRTSDLVGTFKFSPNKEFFAVAERETNPLGFIHIYRFDCSAGIFTYINSITQNAFTYGISFSPDSKFIYAQNGNFISVYDMNELYNNDCDPDSMENLPVVANFPSGNGGLNTAYQLQLANNGNIYVITRNTLTTMGEITDPDNPVTTMVYNNPGPAFGPGQMSWAGLPNNMDGLREDTLDFTYCIVSCDSVCFDMIGCDEPVTWDFGDGTVFIGTLADIISQATNTTTLDPNYTEGTINHVCHKYDTGNYIVTLSHDINGVTVSTQEELDVIGPVTLTAAPALCVTGDPYLLNSLATPSGGIFSCPTCPPGTITLTGPGGGTAYFNPDIAGLGTWTVEYTNFNCTESINITVNNGNWNITTNASLKQDEGYDIITDAEGNIYVVGTFQQTVTFPSAISVTIPNLPLTTPQGAAYVVKYSECGELVWINFDSDDNFGFSKGTAITLDEAKGFVFISGVGEGDVTFQSIPASQGFASTPGATFSMTGSSMYIAKFDMATGEYIDFFTDNFPASTINHQITGLDIHSVTGTSKLFYTGSFFSTTFGLNSAFVGKIDNVAATYTLIWERISTIQSNAISLDVAFNRNEGRVYITGVFYSLINFGSGPFATNYAALSDAFFAVFNGNTGVSNALRKGGTAAGESGEGTGVDVDAAGKTYLTGHFSSDLLNLYNYNPADFIAGLPGVHRGFVLKISGAVHLWNKEIKNDANVKPTGIFVNPSSAPAFSKVFVTGNFDNNNITIPALAGSDGFFLSTSGLPKSFTYCMSQGTGAYQWFNTSTDFTAGSVHNPARITASVTHAYTTGFYSGEYNYNPTATASIPPASGPLFSGPAHNTFIVRNDILNGEYRFEEETTEEQSFETEPGEITIYPNPNNGLFTINLNEIQVENSNIEITDINGKVIYSENNNTEKTKTIDLSHLAPGMYFVKVNDGASNYYKKIIKQ